MFQPHPSHVKVYIPTVTEADLLAFHTQTFGTSFHRSAIDLLKSGVDGDHHGGLGFYADGVERTLTDEQITMFRHSEVESLLREQRRLQEWKEEEEQDLQRLPVSQIAVIDAPKDGEGDEDAGTEEDGSEIEEQEQQEPEDGDEEAEYARFLEAERKEFEAVAVQKRRKGRDDIYVHDRTISTRRRVRELDVVQDAGQILDYGDEATSNNQHVPDTLDPMRGSKVSQSSEEGRRIWWPTISP